MKPVGVPPGADAARQSGGPAAPSAHDQLLAIDTAVLERMREIRSEQARIEAYRKRAEENRSKVEKTVWRRVMDDYARRHAALEQKAAPLDAQVRDEFQKLRTLLERVRRADEEAHLAKEELEFRHEVGELDDSGLEQAIQAPEHLLAQCRTDLEEIEELKARFAEAFKPGEDLSQTAAALAAPAESWSRAVTHIDLLPLGAPGPADPKRPAGDTDETVGDLEAAGAPAAGSPAAVGDRTFQIPLAALIADAAQGGGQAEYRLGAVNIIGRSDDAQIQLTRPGVSRRHALVSIELSGFTIKDLRSQNGTLVNGNVISEARLADGDRVEIGDVRLTFRAPWPPTA